MFKKVFTVLILLLSFSPAISQEIMVNDQPIGEIDVKYLEIVGTSRGLSDKMNIEIDFGQDTKFFSGNKQTRVEDETGKRIKFNSMIDALNFMDKHGFKFVQAYVVEAKNDEIYHYLMKRK